MRLTHGMGMGPQVFKLNNFFTHAEADMLIENALSISDAANKLKRSTTGQGESEWTRYMPRGHL